jgi:F-type H+-transporting ATPase subunit epsilon
MTKQAHVEFFMIRVLGPTSKLYEGKAVSVTASNKVGQFDILAGHANFFSLLLAPEVVIDTGIEKMTIAISGGLMKVNNNVVTLFVNINDATVE